MKLRRLLPSREEAAPPTRLFAARFGTGNVFTDVDAIGLGSDHGETIDGALESCDAAIALIGRG